LELEMIVLLGCGSVCTDTALILQERKRDFLIIEGDAERVEALRGEGFNVVKGDITSREALKKAGVMDGEAVFILSPDLERNRKALKAVKGLSPGMPVIIRGASNFDFKVKLTDVDAVIYPSQVIAEEAHKHLAEIETKLKFKKLVEIIKEADKGIAIVTQNNPDPDAIASAMSLRKIIEKHGIKAEIVYGEEIGHDENKALVNLLGIQMKHISRVNIRSYSKVALVEASIPGVNNPLARDIIPDIIIDHHQVNMKNVKGDYIDIRPGMGANSTILTQYLTLMNVEIDEELATALLYGIKTDTNDFTRGTTPEDLEAVTILYPKANYEVLSKIETPLISAETFDVLAQAIKNRRVKGSYLLSNVGFIRERDTLPQAADYLLNLEGISTVLVYGIANEVIHISGRNRDIRINLGNAMQKAFGDIGQAGGHAHAAAAKISLGLFGRVKNKNSLLRLAEEAVVDRFFGTIGVQEKRK
jgi:nanoRNase/pAp phosphatase (c-di-AMP/oligoRNAs hydrolase)